MINKIGPSIVPWGTLEITGDQSEQLPLHKTCYSNREPSIPCRCSFSNKRSYDMVSKALERSNKMISVCCDRFLAFAQSLQHVSYCANIDLALRYANWFGLKKIKIWPKVNHMGPYHSFCNLAYNTSQWYLALVLHKIFAPFLVNWRDIGQLPYTW